MATNLRSNLGDFFGTGKLPELEAVIQAKFDSYASMIPILFNEEMMTSDIYQTTTLSGLQNPVAKGEAEPIIFQSLKAGFDKTFTAATYATGYRISKEMVNDGKISFIKKATESFAKGMFEIKETDAADVFDNAFTTNGYDGVPLCSTSHPLENGDGATASNRPASASALSLTSFRDLRNIMQSTVNENNQRVKYTPSYFVVPQALQDDAMEIVKSAYNPENANNAINTVYDSIKLLPGGFWNYLDDTNSFFMVADKNDTGLMFLTRQNLETDSDYDKRAFAYELMASIRYDLGHCAWRGVVGNPGA